MDFLKRKVWEVLNDVFPYDFCPWDYDDVVGCHNSKNFLLNWLAALTAVRDGAELEDITC